MRHYETTFILRPNIGEEQFSEIIQRTSDIITSANGVIIDTDIWGTKKLAYEIDKETLGYYVVLNYAAPGDIISEIERIFRLDERVLRFLTIKIAQQIDQDGINKAKEQFSVSEKEETVEDNSTEEQKKTDEPPQEQPAD